MPWGGLTCDRLLEMADEIERALNGESLQVDGNGWGMMYEKLTYGYWRNYVRQETLKAGGEGEAVRSFMLELFK